MILQPHFTSNICESLLLSYVQAGTHHGKYKCSHNINEEDHQRDVHYVSLGARHDDGCPIERGKVTL